MRIMKEIFIDAEYQKFVDSMVQHCHCLEGNRPCDGVLAGGICDGITDDNDDEYEFEGQDADLEDEN